MACLGRTGGLGLAGSPAEGAPAYFMESETSVSVCLFVFIGVERDQGALQSFPGKLCGGLFCYPEC